MTYSAIFYCIQFRNSDVNTEARKLICSLTVGHERVITHKWDSIRSLIQ